VKGRPNYCKCNTWITHTANVWLVYIRCKSLPKCTKVRNYQFVESNGHNVASPANFNLLCFSA